MTNHFELLKNRKILDILNGDVSYIGSIGMPSPTGPKLFMLSNKFGLSVEYGDEGGNLSRWEYLSNLIDHCIKENKMSEFLSFLFSIDRFSEVLEGCSSPSEVRLWHRDIVKDALDKINAILLFSKVELVSSNNSYFVKSLDEEIQVSAPVLKEINLDYIKQISERALQDIDNKHYDSAITKSRTMLEETFCMVIEKKNEVPSSSGNMETLYTQVKTLYNMHQKKDYNDQINGLLQGIQKIIDSIAKMRNIGGDAHGKGSKRSQVQAHHARLFVNSSLIACEFILSVANKSSSKQGIS